MSTDREAFYFKLKGQLEDTTTFPAKYLYKFIVPTDGNQVEEVKSLFDKADVVINCGDAGTDLGCEAGFDY